jgi:two-component system sensor histidine kinase CreC
MKRPLSLIRGAAELLDRELSTEERRRFATEVREETGRIQEIVDRMLQLSLLENRRGIKDVEHLDLSALVADLVAGYQSVAASRGITIQKLCTPALSVKGERFLVKQALGNLIQNAMEFSPQNGKITVFSDPAPGGVSVGVADNGTGMSEGSMEHVFERFYSLPRPATGKKSVGLGLAFAREAVRLHGGEVSIRNRPEGGAIASIYLPQEPPAPMLSAAADV